MMFQDRAQYLRRLFEKKIHNFSNNDELERIKAVRTFPLYFYGGPKFLKKRSEEIFKRASSIGAVCLDLTEISFKEKNFSFLWKSAPLNQLFLDKKNLNSLSPNEVGTVLSIFQKNKKTKTRLYASAGALYPISAFVFTSAESETLLIDPASDKLFLFSNSITEKLFESVLADLALFVSLDVYQSALKIILVDTFSTRDKYFFYKKDFSLIEAGSVLQLLRIFASELNLSMRPFSIRQNGAVSGLFTETKEWPFSAEAMLACLIWKSC